MTARGETCHSPQAMAFLDGVNHLPAPSGPVAEILSSLRQENVNIPGLVRNVGQTPAVAARIMRVANSPFFGCSGRIGSLREAITLLGINQVRTLVTAAALMDVFPRGKSPLNWRDFWSHAFGTGCGSRLLAGKVGLDEDVAFTAGLLHDMGRLVMAVYAGDAFRRVEESMRGEPRSLLDAERAVLGVTHPEIGAELARRWKFPPDIQCAIFQHHGPAESCRLPLANVVYIANMLCLEVKRQKGAATLEVSAFIASAADCCLGISADALQKTTVELEALGATTHLLVGA
ncbi:MAG TPA: HDOD domain-containing protein [Methylococcaceae bacterium]|nr:HDOD domain-containing protein [Methylococcaceae bacterium]